MYTLRVRQHTESIGERQTSLYESVVEPLYVAKLELRSGSEQLLGVSAI